MEKDIPPRRTCDGNFGRPLAGTIQDRLLNGFHVPDMTALFDAEYGPVVVSIGK